MATRDRTVETAPMQQPPARAQAATRDGGRASSGSATRVIAILVRVVLVGAGTGVASAETRPQLPASGQRRAADIASWVTVVAAVTLDTRASGEAPDRERALVRQGIRLGVTAGVVFAAKRFVHRARPCAPDGCGADDPDQSFFSGHAATAFQARRGPRLAVFLPLAISTGGLRVAAGKHWLTDALVGAGVGYAVSFIR